MCRCEPWLLHEHRGYFAQADGGTLFLDEIGDTASEVQALLLRVVQEGEIQPVGGNTRRVDVRPLLSGQFPLQDAVKAFELAKDKTQSTKVQLVAA